MNTVNTVNTVNTKDHLLGFEEFAVKYLRKFFYDHESLVSELSRIRRRYMSGLFRSEFVKMDRQIFIDEDKYRDNKNGTTSTNRRNKKIYYSEMDHLPLHLETFNDNVSPEIEKTHHVLYSISVEGKLYRF